MQSCDVKKTNPTSKHKSARDILAVNLRVLRAKNDISQESLAFTAGINKSYISQIEASGRAVSVDILDKIAIALKIPVADLLRQDDS